MYTTILEFLILIELQFRLTSRASNIEINFLAASLFLLNTKLCFSTQTSVNTLGY